MWVTHISLGILTAAKWKLVKIGATVVRLVTRDGALTTISICSLFAVIVPYSLSSQVSQAHVIFNWPITCVSIACCRIIMNMQTFNISGNNDTTTNTMDFEIDSLNTLPLDRDSFHTPK